MGKATKDSCKITAEVLHGIMTQVVKNRLFNQGRPTAISAVTAEQGIPDAAAMPSPAAAAAIVSPPMISE